MLCSALLSLPLVQTPALETWEFGEPGSRYGADLVLVGDWDGDGVEDYAVGAPRADVQAGFFTYSDHGRVEVRSGATGDLIASTANLFPSDDIGLGAVLAAGFDSDQDGLPEIVATCDLADEIAVLERLSPTSTALVRIAQLLPISTASLREEDFGAALQNVGDLTGDGIADLAIGSPRTDQLSGGVATLTDTGSVRLVSGADWTDVTTYLFGDEFGRFGAALATVADMNGTGSPRELVVGAPGRTNSSSNTAGKVHFVDPSLPSAAANFQTIGAPTVGTGFGAGLLDLGDLSGGPGSELAIGSAVVEPTLGPPTPIGALFFEDVPSGAVALYDLDTLGVLWSRGGAGDATFDGRSLAAGNLDGDAPPELVTVTVRSAAEPARLLALNPVDGRTEHAFRAATALELFPDAATAVGPDLNGDGRSDVLMGSEAFDAFGGATFGFAVTDGAPGPPGPNTWTVGAGQDFETLCRAAMLAGPGDTLLVEPGLYATAVFDRPMDVVGPTSGEALVESLAMQDTDGGRLERLVTATTRLGTIAGRMTVDRLDSRELAVTDCGDVTLHRCTLGPGHPAVRVDGSRVELVDCDAEGSNSPGFAVEGGPALEVGSGGRVLSAESRLRGGGPGAGGPFGPYPPGPAVVLEVGSALDLRGGTGAEVQGGVDPTDPSVDAPDVRSEAVLAFQVKLIVSSTFPALDVDGIALTTLDGLLRPWLEYESSVPLGGTWQVEAFAQGVQPGALYLGLAPADLALPQVLDLPVQVDPTQVIDVRAFLGTGPWAPFRTSYPTPPDPAFAGLEVHVQAFVERSPGVYDATNGGALRLGS